MPKNLELENGRIICTPQSTLVANEKATTLSLSSSTEEIKKYFISILKLSKSNNEFPVNLELVWGLAYSTKRNAFVELKKSFIEGIDFYLMQNNKVVKVNDLVNGIKYDCYLSVPCLEFFIARKVRPVFEVYRQVFHKTAEVLPKVVKGNTTKIKRLEEEIEWLNKRLRMTKAVLDQETKLKCSCFSYLVETKQYSKWEEFRAENSELRRQIRIAKQILSE